MAKEARRAECKTWGYTSVSSQRSGDTTSAASRRSIADHRQGFGTLPCLRAGLRKSAGNFHPPFRELFDVRIKIGDVLVRKNDYQEALKVYQSASELAQQAAARQRVVKLADQTFECA